MTMMLHVTVTTNRKSSGIAANVLVNHTNNTQENQQYYYYYYIYPPMTDVRPMPYSRVLMMPMVQDLPLIPFPYHSEGA